MSFCSRMMRMSGFDVAIAHAALPTLHKEGEKQVAYLNLQGQNRWETLLCISITVKLPKDCTCSIIRRRSVALWQFYWKQFRERKTVKQGRSENTSKDRNSLLSATRRELMVIIDFGLKNHSQLQNYWKCVYKSGLLTLSIAVHTHTHKP